MLCQELLTDEYVANFMMDKHSIRAMFHIFNPGYCNQFMKVGISQLISETRTVIKSLIHGCGGNNIHCYICCLNRRRIHNLVFWLRFFKIIKYNDI